MTSTVSSVFVLAKHPTRTVRLATTGFALVGAAICLFADVAKAADLYDRSPTNLTAKMGSGWGAGPIMVSLLDSARREAPVRGVERQRRVVDTIVSAVVPGPLGGDRDQYLAERKSAHEFDGFVAVAATDIINSIDR